MARRDDLNNALRESLCYYAARVLSHNPLTITHDELLAVAVPEEHREILRSAAQIAKIYGADNSFKMHILLGSTLSEGADVEFRLMTVKDAVAPLAPRNPYWQRELTPAHEVVTSWVTERIRVGREFGRVKLVLDWMIANCDHQQMRFLFPPILQLAGAPCGEQYQQELKSTFVGKYREFKAPKTMPTVSRAMREALQEASVTLTMAAMIEDAPSVARQVLADVDVNLVQRVKVDGMEGSIL